MPAKPPAKLSEVAVAVDFGVFKLDTKWTEDPRQQQAAWAMAVELMTRVATQPIDQHAGLVREALTSLHQLFGVFRQILRDGGPGLGVRSESIGGTALVVLNKVLRPFLADWHPRLLDWESQRAPSVSPTAHEKAWKDEIACRAALVNLQKGLWSYAQALARYAGAA